MTKTERQRDGNTGPTTRSPAQPVNPSDCDRQKTLHCNTLNTSVNSTISTDYDRQKTLHYNTLDTSNEAKPARGVHSPADQPTAGGRGGGQPSSALVAGPYTSQCLKIYSAVKKSSLPNYKHARIPIPSKLNIPAWRKELTGYFDSALLDFLEFGFPMSFNGQELVSTHDNHSSATQHPEHIRKYLKKESNLGAMLGPLARDDIPLDSHTSPMMTRPKKNSHDRRVILDLSWPPGGSVNDGIPKDAYLGEPFKLELPTAHDLMTLIVQHGRGSYLYNADLSRAYRQLRADPLDWARHGITWEGGHYMDVAVPFGVRWGAAACQRTTNAVCFMHNKRGGHTSMPYIDDFVGIAKNRDTAQAGFDALHRLLDDLGLQEAPEKATPPTTKMVWIGLEFDTVNMQVKIPENKLQEMAHMTKTWLERKTASKHQLQSVLGKYFHIAQCVRPARLFLSRMLDTLRRAPDTGKVTLDDDFKKDLLWFDRYMASTNGIYIIHPTRETITIELDSCLSGCGAICLSEYYASEFPAHINDARHPICHLELLNIVVACRLWAPALTGKRLLIRCDNTPAVYALRTARGRDSFMRQCARAAFLVAAAHDVTIDACHKPGAQLELPDALSRLHLDPAFGAKIQALRDFCRVVPHDDLFDVNNVDI